MVQNPLDICIHEIPGAHIFRLLLAPDNLRKLEASELLDESAGRKRIELLDTQNVDVVTPLSIACLKEVVVDLAGADHDALDLSVGPQLDCRRAAFGVVPQQTMEARIRT